MNKIAIFLRYLEVEKRSSPHTLIAYRTDLEQFSSYLETVTKIKPELASHLFIRRWAASLMKAKISARSIRRKLSALQAFYHYLLMKGEISKNPMQKVQIPKMSKTLPVFVEEEAMTILLSAERWDDSFESLRDYLLLSILYGVGLRRAELIGLKVADIDFGAQCILVRGKRNKERVVPFGKQLEELLRKYFSVYEKKICISQKTSLFLTDKLEPLYDKWVYNTVKRYLSTVTTIEKRSPHVLRHTFATHLSDKGAELTAIKELLGHKSLAATQIYTHNSMEKLKRVYEQAFPKAKKAD